MPASRRSQSELVRELTRRDLLSLADSGNAPRMSVYLATPRDSSLAALRIAWTDLMRSAERQLTVAGLVREEVRHLLVPARQVINAREDHALGLAWFASARFSRVLPLAIHVPTTAVIGDRWYLLPLLPLHGPRNYYVLGLSRDDIRFFAGTPETLVELSLDGLPLAPLASMPRERPPAGAFAADRDGASIRAVWHRMGGAAADIDKQRIVAHFREVNAAVSKILGDSQAPLVLGGAGYLHAPYRGINSYPNLMHEGIIGGLRDMTTKELHDRAWPLVESTLRAERTEAVARFAELDGSGRTVSELSAAAGAADDGRLDALLVAAAEVAHLHDDWALLERAVVGTLRHGGTVCVLDNELMPTSTSLAGILK